MGTNVVATGSGAFDLTGLTFLRPNLNTSAGIWANMGLIGTGSRFGAEVDLYNGFTGPTSFGSGDLFNANTGSGDAVGIADRAVVLGVPHGYVSNTALSDSMTFNSATFASLGLTPGVYTWRWGTNGANQFFRLVIGPNTVPDGGSTVSLLGFALLGLAALRRRLGC
jgi:hypothetical protein